MARRLLLDTHAFVWAHDDPYKLSRRATQALTGSPNVYVSSISFFEIAQKVRIGRWPEIVPILHELADVHEQQGGQIVDVDREIAFSAGELIWNHRDPFDRMIAATALTRKLVLISADSVFDDVLNRIW